MSFLHCVTLAMDVISRRGIPPNLNIVHEWIPKPIAYNPFLAVMLNFLQNQTYTYIHLHIHTFIHIYIKVLF